MMTAQQAALRPIETDIRTGLEVIRPSGPLLLVSIDPAGDTAVIGRTFMMPAGSDDAVAWTIAENARGRNCYFTANIARSINKKPGKADMLLGAFCWTDADPNIFAHRSYTAARSYLLNTLAPRLCDTASVVIDSGNGVQAFWRISDQVELPAHQDALERVNSLVGHAFAGPGTHNVDRVMRIPGTINYPTASKLKKGYPAEPSISRLLFSRDTSYTLEQLEQLAGAEHLNMRLTDFLQRAPKAKARYEGDRAGLLDASGSAMDMSMVSMLKLGGFSYSEVREIVGRWPHGSDAGRAQGERYWQRMWEHSDGEGAAPVAPVAPAVAMPAPMKGLERLDIAGFAEVVPEPRRWIFKGWLPERVTGLMHADGGTGKTRIAMQMHVAKAVGRDLFGMDPGEPGVSVMFSAEEESQSLRLILHEVVRSFSLSRSDVELVEQNLHLIDLTAETAPIMYGPNGWTALGHACLAYAMETSATFVSVDNVTACYAGPATEGAHIYGFVNGWKSAVLPASGSVMLLMHENKAAQTTGNRVHAYSGNAAWHNACRARIELTFDRDDPNAREIARPKSNYSAAMAEPLRLLWTSGAFQREAGSGLVESIRGKADVDAVVQVVRELIASGQNVGASMRANNNARSLAVGRGMAVPPGGRFFKAMDQAIAAGKLRVEEYTNAGRNVVKRIVLGGQDDAL